MEIRMTRAASSPPAPAAGMQRMAPVISSSAEMSLNMSNTFLEAEAGGELELPGRLSGRRRVEVRVRGGVRTPGAIHVRRIETVGEVEALGNQLQGAARPDAQRAV